MVPIDTAISGEVQQANQRLEELRRSFDDDIRCANATNTEAPTEFLLLTLSGEAYAYPVAHALEVLQVPPIIPVPGAPPVVLGIINFHGQILSVSTIHRLLGLGASEPGSSSRIIVTKDLPLCTGILVDSVEKITKALAEDIHPLPTTIGDDKARLLNGQIYVDRRPVFLLDIKRLCESESFAVSQHSTGDSRDKSAR